MRKARVSAHPRAWQTGGLYPQIGPFVLEIGKIVDMPSTHIFRASSLKYSYGMNLGSRVSKWLPAALIAATLPLALPATSNAAAGVYEFTNAAATGYSGPTQAQVNTAYSGTTLASAVTINTQGIQEWVVPTTGSYGFEVVGAHGAASTGASNIRGGRGAFITAKKTLTAGTRLYILVGQAGSGDLNHGGGGGASFVRVGTGSDTSTLIVAGGGGGTRTGASANGGDASTTTSGMSPGSTYNSGSTSTFYANTSANSFGSGSTYLRGSTGNAYTDIGYGGLGAASSYGDGGAGWLGDGYDDGGTTTNLAIKLSGTGLGGGATGTAAGGFGGGGNGAGSNGGGGGGGYTGGNGGFVAGGGGSFVNGFETQTIAIDTGRSFLRSGTPVHGKVTISLLTPPGPTTVTLSIAGGVTTVSKGNSISVTATVGSPGKITFLANGKKIAGCISKSVTTSFTCSWKPTVQGNIAVSAVLIPTDAAYIRSVSSNLVVAAIKRSTTR